MKNSKAVLGEIVSAIHIDESAEEKEAIARALLDSLLGIDHAGIFMDVAIPWSPEIDRKMSSSITKINAGEPLQYVVGEAFFYGYRFKVNSAVLIPRPETEEMVDLLIPMLQERGGSSMVVDIGTGSGCIAITLATKTGANVVGTDISAAALEVAISNSKLLKVDVQFVQHDILTQELPERTLDLVVSNPPYICLSESDSMKDNVKLYEPQSALFVPDDDALLFYRAIGEKAKSRLGAGGLIMVETNERYAGEVASLFTSQGYHDAEVLSDLSGKDRFVKAIQPLR